MLIKDGHTVFRYKVGSEPPREIETNATVNDGTYKQVRHFKQPSDRYLSKYTLAETRHLVVNFSCELFLLCLGNQAAGN